jgi:hypothetical protein
MQSTDSKVCLLCWRSSIVHSPEDDDCSDMIQTPLVLTARKSAAAYELLLVLILHLG